MYREKTNRELIEILKIQKNLTFESQLNLNEEFKKRNLTNDVSDLESSINAKKLKIENLDYLKNLGFQFENINNSIKISRTTKAIIIDILAIVLGIVFCKVGYNGIFGIISLFASENEFNLFSLIIQFGMIAIGIIGIKLFNGLKRLIDYKGFELSNTNGIITLKKRLDIKLLEIQKSEALLDLKKESELLTLQLDNIKILSANLDNIVQKMTIRELTKRLKNN